MKMTLAENIDRLLAIDVGAGTQDILLFENDRPVENCVKLVLPSQTKIMAGRIQQATLREEPIALTGQIMGGGPLVSALKRHLKAGFKVYSTPPAAKTIRDDLDSVREMGVEVVDSVPEDAHRLDLKDVDLARLAEALGFYDVSVPEKVAVAVQDHGHSPHGSNRLFRFQHWQRFVEGGGSIARLAYRKPPDYMTRMRAVQEEIPDAILMDTGSAAIWGALCDDEVASRRDEGIVVVNVGNQHTVAVLLKGERVLGLFEHHTVILDESKLGALIDRLREGEITNEEVFGDNGHGAHVHGDYSADGGFRFVTVTGPNRAMAEGLGYYMAVPYGDMMLAGSFGLVAAADRLLAGGG
jgi:uncharacterized protein (DUF1786 family)